MESARHRQFNGLLMIHAWKLAETWRLREDVMSAENWRFWKKTWLHVRPLAKQYSFEPLMAIWSQSVRRTCAEELSSSSTAIFATTLTGATSSINPLFNHRISNARRPPLKQTTFYKEPLKIAIAVVFSETATICLPADINLCRLLLQFAKSFISPLYIRSQMKLAVSILGKNVFFYFLWSVKTTWIIVLFLLLFLMRWNGCSS